MGEHKIIFFFRQNILGRKSVQTDLFSRCTGNQKILVFLFFSRIFQHCSDIRSNCWMLVFFLVTIYPAQFWYRYFIIFFRDSTDFKYDVKCSQSCFFSKMFLHKYFFWNLLLDDIILFCLIFYLLWCYKWEFLRAREFSENVSIYKKNIFGKSLFFSEKVDVNFSQIIKAVGY